MSEWISVDDRLPNFGDRVLLGAEGWAQEGGIDAMFSGPIDEVIFWVTSVDAAGDWNELPLHEVTHWMPLPEPPS